MVNKWFPRFVMTRHFSTNYYRENATKTFSMDLGAKVYKHSYVNEIRESQITDKVTRSFQVLTTPALVFMSYAFSSLNR